MHCFISLLIKTTKALDYFFKYHVYLYNYGGIDGNALERSPK